MPRAEDYTVAWISALSLEYTIACELLDEQYERPAKTGLDDNCYTFGRIHEHNVVIACLPKGRYGTTAATVVVRDLQSSFRSIKFALMVGIAGGVPRLDLKPDIRLGDVVVSHPTPGHGGVLQYDYGKTFQNQAFEETGHLNSPPSNLLGAMSYLESLHERQGHSFLQKVRDLLEQKPKLKNEYQRPSGTSDRLYLSNLVHKEISCDCLLDQEDSSLCILRETRSEPEPEIHYGLIASGNQVIKDAVTRDNLAAKHSKLLCFEMESAGIMNLLGCAAIRGICDYSDSHKNDKWQGYAAATAAVYTKELLSVIRSESEEKSKSKSIPFSLRQVPVARKFVGRHQELEMIRETLLEGEDEGRRIFVIHGSGGMGKTQLAVRFMRKYKNKFDAVFWLHGDTEDNLKRGFAMAAERMDLQDLSPLSKSYLGGASIDIDVVAKDVLSWLSSGEHTNWLMVFDEVDRDHTNNQIPFAYDVTKYFPDADHGAILITTRLQRLCKHGSGSLKLNTVDDDTAKLMLNIWLPSDEDSHLRAELLRRLAGMPLAISQAGAFMEETGTNLQIYIDLYDKQWARLVAESSSSLFDYENKSIWTTWELSFDAVSVLDQHAINLLIIWSYFDCKDLWFELLEKASSNSSFAADLAIQIGNIHVDRKTFLDAMGTLRAYSLLESSKDKESYSVHPVISRWLFHQKHKMLPEAKSLALSILGLALEQMHGPTMDARVLPLAQAVCVNALGISFFTEDSEYQGSLDILGTILPQRTTYLWMALRNLGNLFGYHDNTNVAKVLLKGALLDLQQRSALISIDTQVALISRDLAVVYYHQNELVLAETSITQSYQEYKACYGDINKDTIFSLNILGWICSRLGKRDEALRIGDRVLEVLEQLGDPLIDEFVNATYILATLQIEEGNPGPAEQILSEILEKRRATERLFPNHSGRILRVNANLSWVYVLQHRLLKAEDLLITTVKGMLSEFGAEHEDTIRVRHQLAGVYFLGGKFEAAETLLFQATEQYRSDVPSLRRLRLFGKAFGCLGNLYHMQKKWSEARRSFQEGLTHCEDLDQCSSKLFEDMTASLREVKAQMLPNNIDALAELGKQSYLVSREGEDGLRRVEVRLDFLRESYRPTFQVFWRLLRRPSTTFLI